MIQPYDAYAFYNALKLHFTSDYDAIKYNYKTSANPKSFWKRKDKYYFAKVAKRFSDPSDMIDFYVSHFINGSKWVGDMLSKEENYNEWQKINQALTYYFEGDMQKLSDKVDSFDGLFLIGDSPYPYVVSEYLSEDISLETVVILNKLTNFMKKANKEVTDTIVWPDVYNVINKYDPFVKADLNKCKKVILKLFTQ
jgi:hypothetical protein